MTCTICHRTRDERDALAARLAAVEALADRMAKNLYVAKGGRRQCRACNALLEARRRASKRSAA